MRSALINFRARSDKENYAKFGATVRGRPDNLTPAGKASTREGDPAKVGQLSPLIPLSKDAIHAGLSWTPDSKPKVCFGMRPSEYIRHQLVDKAGQLKDVIQQLVYGDYGFSTGPHGVDQSVANGEIERENFVCLAPSASMESCNDRNNVATNRIVCHAPR